jgi:hypothetical protein
MGLRRSVGAAALHRFLPLDRERVLEVGAADVELARTYPWLDVTRSPDQAELPPGHSGEFDCIYAAEGVSAVRIASLGNLLGGSGCLVTRRRRSGRDIVGDLREAGFADIRLRGSSIVAWRRARDPFLRARELTHWAHMRLDPGRSQASSDPVQILAGGYAWCWGYVMVLGEALRREGYDLRYVTMLAEDHPRGRGDRAEDSHEVIELELGHARFVCDPMADVVFEASLSQLLADPSRADVPRAETERYRKRGYELYSTSEWYRRVKRVAMRRRPSARLRYVPADRVASGTARAMITSRQFRNKSVGQR